MHIRLVHLVNTNWSIAKRISVMILLHFSLEFLLFSFSRLYGPPTLIFQTCWATSWFLLLAVKTSPVVKVRTLVSIFSEWLVAHYLAFIVKYGTVVRCRYSEVPLKTSDISKKNSNQNRKVRTYFLFPGVIWNSFGVNEPWFIMVW